QLNLLLQGSDVAIEALEISLPDGRDSGTNPAPAQIRRQYSYDAVGNVTQEVDGRGIATRYVVNQLNQVVQTVHAAAHDSHRFDFGTPVSPVAAGYTQVTEATAYSAAQGYGWQPGPQPVFSLDRGVGTDVTRDFNFTTDATFAVDLINGIYQVAV